MFAVEVVLSLSGQALIGGREGIGWRIAAWEDYGFSPAFMPFLFAPGVDQFDVLKRFVTYAFIHASFTDAAFAIVITLAIGKFVGEVMRDSAMAILYIACTILPAIIFGLVAPDGAWLFSGYAPAYGLIGAYTYILWIYLRRRGERQIAAFRLIGFLLALQIVYTAIFGASSRWIAEVPGFIVGFCVTPILLPGGWSALLAKLRTR
ncbi:rhomboid family intramembrane serine protease [Pelagovum pacificum]|uniref:Rhomboid family intramembrane serine protease n=2 Tax=Pelagovum pacificum TaxID=2588711 RepID=A0A5C5GCK1_9RHOB|nr:rhomboid family intramembrane serine protease [Pelagovum pacificum]TNY31694.1 rhomboid family intramembrane serine protease [Pelagovum pacificum]